MDARARSWRLALVATAAVAGATAAAAPPKCPPDSVRVGTACIDKYEASVWLVPGPTTVNRALVKKIQAGSVTLADLEFGAATQLGASIPPFSLSDYPSSFPAEGDWTPAATSGPATPGVYAVSISGVLPSTALSWFQADQACALSGKRLPTNYEWQVATAGTPDPGDADDGATTCNTGSAAPAPTGARSACASAWGVHDTIGNVWEWVADWHESNSFLSGPCLSYLGDTSCFGHVGPYAAATQRGGDFAIIRGSMAGSFAIDSLNPVAILQWFGFRCAR